MSTTQGRYQVASTGRFTVELEGEDGAKVGTANITAATLTLIDAATRTYIRGTSSTPQDVRGSGSGTNNCQIADGTNAAGTAVTNFGWDIQTTDVALVNGALSREEHIAQFLITYTASGISKVLRHDHRLRCIDAPGLCTYDDVVQVGLVALRAPPARTLSVAEGSRISQRFDIRCAFSFQGVCDLVNAIAN